MTLDVKLIDKRVVRRNLERGRVDAAAYQRLLDTLPDASGNVQRAEPSAQTVAASEPRVEPLRADLSASAAT